MSYQPQSTLPDAAESVRRAANEFRDELDTGARDIADAASQQVGRVREQAREWVSRNSARAKDAALHLREEAQAAGDRTQQYVREEPFKSVAIAAAAGAAIAGLLMLWRQSGSGR
jgi:ElaB/YqjD/DUF883 family membrane-anchored ribosome-binding protein